MNSAESKKLRVIGIMAVIGMALMVGMTVVVATYSVIVSDDFYYAQNIGKNVGGIGYLWQCVKYAGMVYTNWQGTYSAEFIAAILNPVNNSGFVTLRWVMIANVILYYGALLTLVSALTKRLFPGHIELRAIIMTLVVFVMAEYDAFPEIFNWYVGATVYSVPFSFGLIAVAAFVTANNSENLKDEAGGTNLVRERMLVAVSGICGLIAVGGSLAISGTVCYALMILLLYYWIRDRKLTVKNLIMFGFSFSGSLINAVAPGNFVRQDAESSAGLDIAGALSNAVEVYFSNVRWLFEQRNFAAVLILALICGLYVADKSKVCRGAWIIVSVMALLTPFVTIFPVVLGYNLPWMPNRCVFIAFTAFALAFINLAMMIGSAFAHFVKKAGVLCALKVGLALIAIVLAVVSPFGIRSYKSVRHLKALIDHKYQDHYEMVRGILEELPEHEGEDVVLEVTVPTSPDEIENYYSFYLVDKDNWINRAIAWSYGLNSISNKAD